MSFLDFLLRLRTYDPGRDGTRAIPAWPYISELARALETHDRVLVVKSRQMLVTWIGCAHVLYRALTGGPGVHLVISKEERSANEMIERIRFLAGSLPREFASETISARRNRIELPDRDARILSLPAAPHAVRGLSPATVFWDEIAFTPHDELIWSGVKPAVDSGGRLLAVSTPNGPTGVFHRLVHQGGDRFRVHRDHYSQNPERTRAWERSARAGLSDARWRREQELSFEGAEGKVYDQFDAHVHVLDEPFVPGRREGVRLYRGIDFGYLRPAVVWAEEAADGSLVVFDNLLGDRWSLDELIRRIRLVDRRHGLRARDFTWTAVDPAGAARNDYGIAPAQTLRERGFRVVYRPSTIMPGLEAVRALLMDANGSVRLQLDPRCTALRNAFEGYAWSARGELPVKDGEHDHLMDALRYLVINLPRFQPAARDVPPRVSGVPG